MKTIVITIAMTEAQYELLMKESAKDPDNSSIQGQLEAAVSHELRNMIDWSDSIISSNDIDVNAI